MYSRMNSLNASMSPFTPQNFFISSVSAARLYPVPIASISTRSLLSSSVYGLSSMRYGAGGMNPSGCSTTRRGPSAPMCNQIDADPGPPLKANVSGRFAAS